MAETLVQGAHLVGSVPLSSANEVFQIMGEHLGKHLRRIPDGETGDRSLWINYQAERFKKVPGLEIAQQDSRSGPPIFRLRDGVDPEEVGFDNLGYADVALASYELFARLQNDGAIAPDVRFQVSLPTPRSVVLAFLAPSFDDLRGPYEAALLREVDRICAGIPHDKLAIQWDVAMEVVMWPGLDESLRQAIVEMMERSAAAVPSDVEVGIHLCYGDFDHKHMVEPTDLGICVEIANAFSAAVSRPIQWMHLPVPIERDDDAYFAPLAGLKLHPETELYLGLVHIRDGVVGTQKRIVAAKRVVPAFGVATECGMGRRQEGRGGAKDELVELLAIHAAVAQPVR